MKRRSLNLGKTTNLFEEEEEEEISLESISEGMISVFSPLVLFIDQCLEISDRIKDGFSFLDRYDDIQIDIVIDSIHDTNLQQWKSKYTYL